MTYVPSVLRLTFATLFLLAMIPGLYCISLPAVFTDHMVLPQEKEARFWGWGKPREEVTITASWSNIPIKTIVDARGSWEADVPTPGAGGPHTIQIKGYNTVELTDVLIGQVWFCAGQSNMEWTARMGIDDAMVEVQRAHYPEIRFFRVPHRTAMTPQLDIHTAEWKACSPNTMIDNSALAYFFAREMQDKLKVPIGLIDVSWGGTPIETWIASDHISDQTQLNASAELLNPGPWGPNAIASIYNAMVSPLTEMSVNGILWYQGESNTGNPAHYQDMMELLVSGWRKAWGEDLPFYYVQIAPYHYDIPASGAMIRDAQRRSLRIPNTGMIVTSDIGDTTDIHPGNKQVAGLRLARLALADQEKYTEEVYGPLYDHIEIKNSQVYVFFTHSEGLHTTLDDLDGFEVAGDDGFFHSATARIENDVVILDTPEVLYPRNVRFGWTNTSTPSLFNRVGLPASTFHTADWRMK